MKNRERNKRTGTGTGGIGEGGRGTRARGGGGRGRTTGRRKEGEDRVIRKRVGMEGDIGKGRNFI